MMVQLQPVTSIALRSRRSLDEPRGYRNCNHSLPATLGAVAASSAQLDRP